jgi:uncharacterized protein (UPF0262 family)
MQWRNIAKEKMIKYYQTERAAMLARSGSHILLDEVNDFGCMVSAPEISLNECFTYEPKDHLSDEDMMIFEGRNEVSMYMHMHFEPTGTFNPNAYNIEVYLVDNKLIMKISYTGRNSWTSPIVLPIYNKKEWLSEIDMGSVVLQCTTCVQNIKGTLLRINEFKPIETRRVQWTTISIHTLDYSLIKQISDETNKTQTRINEGAFMTMLSRVYRKYYMYVHGYKYSIK